MKESILPRAQTKKVQNTLEKYKHNHKKSRRCDECHIFIWKHSNDFSQ